MWRSDPERRGSDCSYGITVGSNTDTGAVALGTMANLRSSKPYPLHYKEAAVDMDLSTSWSRPLMVNYGNVSSPKDVGNGSRRLKHLLHQILMQHLSISTRSQLNMTDDIFKYLNLLSIA